MIYKINIYYNNNVFKKVKKEFLYLIIMLSKSFPIFTLEIFVCDKTKCTKILLKGKRLIKHIKFRIKLI